jgi:hypothetical protein
MWETRRLTALWASTACYRGSFTFLLGYGRIRPYYDKRIYPGIFLKKLKIDTKNLSQES